MAEIAGGGWGPALRRRPCAGGPGGCEYLRPACRFVSPPYAQYPAPPAMHPRHTTASAPSDPRPDCALPTRMPTLRSIVRGRGRGRQRYVAHGLPGIDRSIGAAQDRCSAQPSASSGPRALELPVIGRHLNTREALEYAATHGCPDALAYEVTRGARKRGAGEPARALPGRTGNGQARADGASLRR